MKILGLFFLWLATLAASAQTNPVWQVYRSPVRVFGAHPVNLTPLYQWWARQPAPTNNAGFTAATIDQDTNAPVDDGRPLAAWHRLTGTHIGTLNNGSWVIQAVIYTSPSSRTNARVILNHPPNGEEQSFVTLETQLAATIQQLTNTQRAYKADVKAEQKDQQRADAYRHSWDKVASDGVSVYSRAEAKKQEEAKTASDQQQQLQTQQTQIEAQLKAIPMFNGAYHVDWFAVMLGRTKQGLPIYDMGVVGASPQ